MDAPPPPSRLCARSVGRFLLVLVPVGVGSLWGARSGIGVPALQEMIRAHPAAPAVFMLVHIPVSLLFLPRTVMAVTAGLLFGAAWGVVWAALGGLLGAVTGFLLARAAGGARFPAQAPARVGAALRSVERGGWRAVATLRLVPVLPHSAVNYALGLTRLPLGAYALGSLLGQLPMTVAGVELGAAGSGALIGQPGWLAPAAAGLALLALSTLLPKLAARRA